MLYGNISMIILRRENLVSLDATVSVVLETSIGLFEVDSVLDQTFYCLCYAALSTEQISHLKDNEFSAP